MIESGFLAFGKAAMSLLMFKLIINLSERSIPGENVREPFDLYTKPSVPANFQFLCCTVKPALRASDNKK